MPRKKTIATVEQKPFVVAAYIRVSTEDQAESGLGLDAQRNKVNAMSMIKDWTEPTIYADEGISGTKKVEQRPGLKHLMEDVQQGKVDAVIINSLDRLGRRASIIINLVEQFATYKVALVSCKENFDTSTPHGQFVTIIFAAIAQLERDQIAMRTKEAMTEKGKIDGEKGGRLPYGYERIFTLNEKTGEYKAKGIIIAEDRAEIVRIIFRLRAENMTMQTIATFLNKKNHISPRGSKWYASGVREILLNAESYAGGYRGDSQIKWPAILGDKEQA